jgi:hypothetical protein
MSSKNTVVQLNQKKNEIFTGTLQSYREKIHNISASNGLAIVDLQEANIFRVMLRQPVTNITFDNLPDANYSYSCTFVFIQDNNGKRKVIFPENVYWSFNETAILTPTPGHADVITLMTFDGGETYYAAHALANLGK